MERIKVHDKWFKLYISAVEIEAAVNKVAREVNRVYKDSRPPVFVSVLNGAFMFTSDLLKKIDFDCNLSFIKYASYDGEESAGRLNEIMGLNDNIEGRDVIVLDEIVDSGTTMQQLKRLLKDRGAADVKVATLIYKPNSCRKDLNVDFYGIRMEDNNFVVGYGLDYNGRARNYEDIYILL